MSYHKKHYGIRTYWLNGLSDWVYTVDGPLLDTIRGNLIDTANRLRSTLNWHWPELMTVVIEAYTEADAP